MIDISLNLHHASIVYKFFDRKSSGTSTHIVADIIFENTN